MKDGLKIVDMKVVKIDVIDDLKKVNERFNYLDVIIDSVVGGVGFNI